MTAVRDAIRRLGEPGAISWLVFWVTYVINVLIALVSGFDADATWPQRVIAASVGQVVMFGFLALMRLTFLNRLTDLKRGVATLIAFVIAGAIRGMSVSAAFIVMGPSGPEVLIPRLPAGIAFGLVVLIPVALVAVTLQSYRSTRAELHARRLMLEAARTQIVDDLEQRDTQVEDRVRSAFAEAVAEELPADESAQRLREFTADVVRPLSHQLAGAVPSWEYRNELSDAGRITVRGVIDRGAQGAPFLPWLTALTAALLSASWFIWEEGLAAAIVYLVGGVLGVVVGLSVANAVLRRMLPGRSLFARVVMVVIGALFAGFVFGVVATVLASSTPWIRALWAAGMVFYPLFALVLALVRATNSELRESVSELRRVDEDLAWQVARLHQMQWVRQRTTARALHGPVQAMMAAAAHQLSMGADQRLTLQGLRDQLGDALDPDRSDAVGVTWRDALTRIEATWQGVCEVVMRIDNAASLALDRDGVAAGITSEIISEGVSNAVRHGKAHIVTLTLTLRQGVLDLELSNDGRMTEGASSGLGTQLLEDCTISWSRDGSDGIVTLIAELPVEI